MCMANVALFQTKTYLQWISSYHMQLQVPVQRYDSGMNEAGGAAGGVLISDQLHGTRGSSTPHFPEQVLSAHSLAMLQHENSTASPAFALYPVGTVGTAATGTTTGATSGSAAVAATAFSSATTATAAAAPGSLQTLQQTYRQPQGTSTRQLISSLQMEHQMAGTSSSPPPPWASPRQQVLAQQNSFSPLSINSEQRPGGSAWSSGPQQQPQGHVDVPPLQAQAVDRRVVSHLPLVSNVPQHFFPEQTSQLGGGRGDGVVLTSASSSSAAAGRPGVPAETGNYGRGDGLESYVP